MVSAVVSMCQAGGKAVAETAERGAPEGDRKGGAGVLRVLAEGLGQSLQAGRQAAAMNSFSFGSL